MVDEDECQWLTYADLAAALDLKLASARRLAFRKGWRRTAGNDGLARVAVPMAELRRDKANSPSGAATDNGDDTRTGRTNAVAVADMMAALVADRRASEGRAAALVREVADLKEQMAAREVELAGRTGELMGLREALRLAEASGSDAAQRAVQVQREAAEVQGIAEAAKQEVAAVRGELARLRARSFWARVLNRD